RVNLLSAVFAALAVWVLYLTIHHLTHSVPASAAGAILYSVQAIPWAQAGVAEINSLTTLLIGLAFLALLKWGDGAWPLPIFALVYGVAVSHHRTALLYAPFLLAFGLLAARRGTSRRLNWRDVGLSIGLFLLPFVSYVYLPLRGDTNPAYPNNWTGFWTWLSGGSALGTLEGSLQRPDVLMPRLRSIALGQVFWRPQGWWLALLGLPAINAIVLKIVGRSFAARQPERVRLLNAATLGVYLGAFLLGISFATLYDILDVGDYLGVVVFMWCVVAGVGLFVAATYLEGLVQRWRISLGSAAIVQSAIVAGVIVLALFTAYRNLARTDLRVDYSNLDRQTFWAQVKEESRHIPQGGVLVADWPQANEARYFRAVERWRPDLSLWVVDDLLVDESLGGASIKQWFDEQRPVFLLGQHEAILARFDTVRQGTFWRLTGHRETAAPPPMEHRVNRRFGAGIVLEGYTIRPDPGALHAGDLLQLTLYWRATERIHERYVVFNHVIDELGNKIGQSDGEPQLGAQPTTGWQVGEIITDTYTISLDPQAQPGTYRLMTGLYTRLGNTRLEAFSEDGRQLGDYPQLTEITIR
ncbi:MAG TPA: DUF2723 domain-containing protein, partial [Chloroflexia bacterium]|nr:DUF2723 domain-containing protein [Chloroflexia bacterium]